MTYGWGILAVLIIGIVMWQLGIFEGGVEAVTYRGFARIKPIANVIELKSDGTFQGTFENLNGVKVSINAVNATNRFDSVDCTAAAATPLEVPHGEFFKIDASGCTSQTHQPGEDYELDVTIEYDMTVVGIAATHRDGGTIRGMYN